MDILTAIAARPITVSDPKAQYITTVPAGTEVYATPARNRDGWFNIRVCGTLLTQRVTAGSLLIP